MSDMRLQLTDLDVRDTRSYPKNWSAEQRRHAASGLHPMGMPYRGDETCGSCVHAFKRLQWWKCRKCRVTSGSGTDIRVGWPACVMWDFKETNGDS